MLNGIRHEVYGGTECKIVQASVLLQRWEWEMIFVEENITKNILEDEEIRYIADEKLIDDSLCPKCLQKINNDTEFCQCGFYARAAKVSSNFSLVFFLLILVVVAGLILTKTSVLSSLEINMTNKIAEKGMSSTASPVIQVADKLAHSDINYLIRDIYYQDYKNTNKLIVVVKPEYWPAMKPQTKEYVLNTITNLWGKAYKGENPQVKFANP